MAADKVVPAPPLEMVWQKPAPDRYLWRAGVEVDAAEVGGLFLFVNPNLPRSWIFKLSLRGEEVIRWDVRPLPGGHNNPPGRPDDFPAKVPEPEHEHIWIEGLNCNCARPLDGLAASDHRAILEKFCLRTHVRINPAYRAPQAYEQLRLADDS